MYEQFGVEGLGIPEDSGLLSREGLWSSGDVKRGYGSTSAAYATGHLERYIFGAEAYSTFDEGCDIPWNRRYQAIRRRMQGEEGIFIL